MDAKQNTEFTRRLVALAEVFDVKMSPQRQALYFEALRDLEFASVVAAMNASVRTSKYMPRPAELRGLVVGDSEDQAESAWVTLRQAMHRIGAYSSVSFQDPALGESVLSLFGSWPAACQADLTPEMWASKRKEFGRVYRVFQQRQLDGVRYLPGICEQTNGGSAEWRRYVPLTEIGRSGEMKAIPIEPTRTRLAVEANVYSEIQSMSSLSIETKDEA